MDGFHAAQLGLRIALAAGFAVMGVLHFVPAGARTMRAMIPPPLRRPGLPAVLVATTGACELLGAAGLLAPWAGIRVAAGVGLALYLIAVFPANAHAARDPARFGRLAIPFWPRLGIQLLLIGLVIAAVWPTPDG